MTLPKVLLTGLLATLSGLCQANDLTLDAQRLDRIDAIIEAAINQGEIPGGNLLISQGNTIIKQQSYGTMTGAGQPVDDNTLFRLFSMTKPVTVVAALILYERGHFLLDDPITELWPELGDIDYYVSGEGDDMVTALANPGPTVRQLMMHTAGYYYPYGFHPVHKPMLEKPFPTNGISITEVAAEIASYPLLHKPGERWNYGYSLDVLAGLIEYLAQEPYDQFIQREILDPLGMKDTGYYVPPEKADRLMDNFNFDDDGQLIVSEKAADSSHLKEDPLTWGGTGLIGPIEDYWRFCRMLLQGGTYDGVRVLSPLSIEYMLTNHIPEEELPYEPEGTPFYRFSKGYGFGLGVKVMVSPSESENLGSVGESSWSGAASTYFWVVPEYDLAILVFSQNQGYLRVQPIMESIRVAVYQSLVSD